MNQQPFMEQVKYQANGLIPVIAQDYHSKKVRMLAYMNEEALRKTLETGRVHYYSRQRQALWLKGETSGHYQYVKQMSLDCDGDTLLLQIVQEGGISCHTGHATCFFKTLSIEQKTVEVTERPRVNCEKTMLEEVYDTIKARQLCPKEGSYTSYLFEQGENKMLKKLGEEATEIVIAAKDHDKQEVVFEIADFMYHLSVLMASQDIDWMAINEELKKRH